MTDRASLSAGAYDVGDIKLRYAPNSNAVESTVTPFKGQEWLRTGYLVPYAAKYATHLLMGIGRGLYAYDALLEQSMSVGSVNAKAQVTIDYLAGRYYFYPDNAGAFCVQTKAAFDSAASIGTTSTAMPAGQAITEMRGFFVIKSGANAGRAFVSTDGNAGYKLLYNTGDMTGAWTDAGLGVVTGGNPRLIIGKPDGSLLVALADALANANGAGNIKTSVNGGTVWAAQTCNLGAVTNPFEGLWCATLNKFVMVAVTGGVPRYFTSADGYNWTQEAGTAYTIFSSKATAFIADNGAATFVVGANQTLYRSTGGGAFAAVATPRQLVAICSSGANLYAVNSSGGLEYSTDNGATWTVLGQTNGPAGAALAAGGNVIMKVANGNLFVTGSAGICRFSLQALPSLTPDRVGAVYAVAVPSGQTNAANYVRIL